MLIGGQATGMHAAFRTRSEETRFLAVGEHVVDVDTLRLVTSPGTPRLTPKAAAVLLQLVRAAGRTLSRDELLNEVWKGTCPTQDVLTQAVTTRSRISCVRRSRPNRQSSTALRRALLVLSMT